MINSDDYGNGYDIGYQDGRADGHAAGWRDCEVTYEQRIAKLYAELLELNARVTIVERDL